MSQSVRPPSTGTRPASAARDVQTPVRRIALFGDRALAFLGQRAVIEIVAILGFCVLVWVWRRPEQVVRPYVWVEEAVILGSFFEDGWSAALEPINGYLILPSTVLVTLAADLSVVQLPGLMSVFALAVFVATVLLLVIPESRWGDRTVRAAMAVIAVLVPTNPEVFGVLLYSFWWTTLWPLIILGWTRSHWPLRAPLLAVGALSSPAGAALFALFAVAYARGRRLHDAISGGILAAGFVVQVVLTLTSERAESLAADATVRNVLEQSLRVGGFFETTWLGVDSLDTRFVAFCGLLLFAFLLIAAVHLAWAARRDEALLMSLAGLGFTVLSAVPAPLISDPVDAGPRYFFLPFIAFGWTLLLLITQGPLRPLRLAAAILLGVSFLNLGSTFSRPAEKRVANLTWKVELEKCAASTAASVPVPIYFDGSTALFWNLDLTPSQCRDFLD